jgi:hypothetical protein
MRVLRKRSAFARKQKIIFAHQEVVMRIMLCLLALAIWVPIANAEEIRLTPNNAPIVARTDPSTDWVAIAASPNRRIFKVGNLSDEAAARARAKNECELTTGRTCNVMTVPSSWDVSVLHCEEYGRRGTYLGGSGQGYAEQIAKDKAVREGFSADACTSIYTY